MRGKNDEARSRWPHSTIRVAQFVSRRSNLSTRNLPPRWPGPICGTAQEVLRTYLVWVDDRERRRKGGGDRVVGRGLIIERVTVHDVAGAERYLFESGDPLEIRFEVLVEQPLSRPWFSVGVTDGRPGALVLCSMLEGHVGFDLSPGKHVVSCRLGPLPLGPRVYELYASVREGAGAADLLDWAPVGAIRVTLPESSLGPSPVTTPWLFGPVRVKHEWQVRED